MQEGEVEKYKNKVKKLKESKLLGYTRFYTCLRVFWRDFKGFRDDFEVMWIV